MKPNRSLPPGSIFPVLAYPVLDEAVAWVTAAFGFTERLRIGDHRAQLFLGDAGVVLTGGASRDRSADGAARHSVMVRVEDVDAHCRNAAAHGATILRPPESYPYGERQYTAADTGGHAWTFTQTLEDVDPRNWGGQLKVGHP
jgi:uncharacterized glyoxalase superfamily protein PhnB